MPGGYTPGNFNSRPSARGDPILSTVWCNTINFNSRPSARGDSKLIARAITQLIFQFTPLREGRLPSIKKCNQDAQISIHAPPRGATCAAEIMDGNAAFQFTPLREGRRGRYQRRYARQRRISIHAPPRGATDAYKQQVETEKKFQFTPLREGRLLRSCTYHLQSNFNSRPSARGDGRTWYADYTYGEFQFTPLREGRRRS